MAATLVKLADKLLLMVCGWKKFKPGPACSACQYYLGATVKSMCTSDAAKGRRSKRVGAEANNNSHHCQRQVSPVNRRTRLQVHLLHKRKKGNHGAHTRETRGEATLNGLWMVKIKTWTSV